MEIHKIIFITVPTWLFHITDHEISKWLLTTASFKFLNLFINSQKHCFLIQEYFKFNLHHLSQEQMDDCICKSLCSFAKKMNVQLYYLWNLKIWIHCRVSVLESGTIFSSFKKKKTKKKHENKHTKLWSGVLLKWK